MIQDKIFFDEKDPTGVSYNTPFTVYGSYEGRLWSKTPSGEIKYYTQNSDLSVYATTGSNQFKGAQDVTGSLTVTGSFNLNDSATNFNILGNQFGETYLISNNGNIVLHPVGDSEGIVIIKETDLSVEGDITVNNLYASNGVVSGSSQIVEYNVFATTGSNQFDGSQAITGSLTVTGQVVAQTLNVQQVTSSIVFSSGSNIFGNDLGNTQQFTGSVSVTGSLTSNGALNGTSASFSAGVNLATSTSAVQIGPPQSGSTFKLLTLSSNGNDLDTGTVLRLIGNSALDLVDISVKDTITRIFHQENSVDALDGYGKIQFRTNATANASFPTRGGFQFTINNTDALTIASTGAATFSSSVTAGGAFNGGTLNINTSTGSERINVNGAIGFQNTSGVQKFHVFYSTGSGGLNFTETGVADNRLFLRDGGNVGIGTASPSQKLVVEGSAAVLSVVDNRSFAAGVGGALYLFGNYRSIGDVTVAGYIKGSKANSTEGDYGFDLIFANQTYTGGVSEKMRITSGGYLKASNTGTYINSGGSYHEINSDQTTYALYIKATNASPYGTIIDYSSLPNNTGNEYIYCTDNSFTTLRFSVRSNGGIANYQANDVNLSDERTKKDIEPLESYWDKFKNIEIVKFKYKDQTHDDYNIGVIAQQVEAVAPEFVDVDGWNTKPKLDEEGNTIVSEEEPLKSIYTADLHHATIKVLQEAMTKIESLEAILQRNNIS